MTSESMAEQRPDRVCLCVMMMMVCVCMCVSVCGESRLQLRMRWPTGEGGGPLQQCGYQRNQEARPEREVCALSVCVCRPREQGSCYQLSPKL